MLYPLSYERVIRIGKSRGRGRSRPGVRAHRSLGRDHRCDSVTNVTTVTIVLNVAWATMP